MSRLSDHHSGLWTVWIRSMKTATLSDMLPFKPAFLKPQLKDSFRIQQVIYKHFKILCLHFGDDLKSYSAHSEFPEKWPPRHDLRFSFGMYLTIKVRPTSLPLMSWANGTRMKVNGINGCIYTWKSKWHHSTLVIT